MSYFGQWDCKTLECFCFFSCSLPLPGEHVQASLLEDERLCGRKPIHQSRGHPGGSRKILECRLLKGAQLKSATSGPDQQNYSVNLLDS